MAAPIFTPNSIGGLGSLGRGLVNRFSELQKPEQGTQVPMKRSPKSLSGLAVGPEGGTSTFALSKGQKVIAPDVRTLGNEDLRIQLSRLQDLITEQGDIGGTSADITAISDELRRRGGQSQTADIEQLRKDIGTSDLTPQGLGQVGAAGGGGGGISEQLQSILAEETARQQGQRNLLQQQFGEQRRGLTEAIGEQFAPIRSRQIEEEAALGRLRSPVSIPNISRIDERQSQALAQGLSGLSQQNLAQQIALEQDLANRMQRAREFGTQTGLEQQRLGLSGQELGLRERLGLGELGQRERLTLAELGQRGRQFGQTQDLERQKFTEAKRQGTIADIREREKIGLAERIGRMQAEAAEPSILGQVGGIVGGLGGLVGGIGGLAGGIGALRTANLAAEGAKTFAQQQARQQQDRNRPPQPINSLRANSVFTPRNF